MCKVDIWQDIGWCVVVVATFTFAHISIEYKTISILADKGVRGILLLQNHCSSKQHMRVLIKNALKSTKIQNKII